MAEEVVKEVLWTDLAKFSFDSIIDYLHTTWTEREVRQFVTKTSTLIATL